jgi:hypothetical protein
MIKIKPYNIDEEKARDLISGLVNNRIPVSTKGVQKYINNKYEYELGYHDTQEFYKEACAILKIIGHTHVNKEDFRE